MAECEFAEGLLVLLGEFDVGEIFYETSAIVRGPMRQRRHFEIRETWLIDECE